MKRAAFIALAAALAMAPSAQAAETAQAFPLLDEPVPVPEIAFADGAGTPRSLADFRGKIVLLNIWATWCVPCRTEMPTLDRLQGQLGGPDFEVVALSIDRNGAEAVRKFFSEIGVQYLDVNIDVSSRAAFSLAVVGLPATLLIDRNGMEMGRLIGPAEWDAPEMVAFLESVISGGTGPTSTQQQQE